jgi:hypothetical protein
MHTTYGGELRAQPAIGTPSNTQVRQSTPRALQPALPPPSDHKTERDWYARGRATERTSYKPKKKKICKSQAQLAAEMVYLGVHEGPAAVARAMG